ncbi:MAG: DUF5345 family protein [Firmicutes bacterium]|nr:DUF5345 family protein [Bacillota bacterium]
MKNETEFDQAIVPIKPALDAFDQEVEAMMATSSVPPLSYFQELVEQTQKTARRRAILETLLFPVVALLYLAGLGLLLQNGYAIPLMIGYAGVALFLPFVIILAQPE